MHDNVSAALENSHIFYRVRKHNEFSTPIKSPQDFANALGYDLKRITKSLFLESKNADRYAIAVCSIDKKVNFSVIAGYLECKRIEVASKEALKNKLGYPSNGVSPLGIEEIPIFMDKGLFSLETILIGAGETGVEIEISPLQLKDITSAVVLDF